MIEAAFMFCLAIPVRGARGVARMSEMNIILFLIIPWFVSQLAPAAKVGFCGP